MGKVTVRKDIKEAREILADIMREHLSDMAETRIDQIMKNYKALTPARKIDAIKNLPEISTSHYKKNLLKALAVIAGDAIEKARKEVPKASKVKLSEWNEEKLALGEFDDLPPKVRKRLTSQVDVLLKTQKDDLDKRIMLQFSSSVETTDSGDIIRYDVFESAEDYILGPSVDAGSGVMGARAINEARQAFFFDDEVLEEIDAFQFKNDVPETPICEDLNGKIFAKDDPEYMRYYPPLHFNCDSYVLPILKGNLKDRKISRLKPSDSELDKYVQFSGDDNCKCRVMLITID